MTAPERAGAPSGPAPDPAPAATPGATPAAAPAAAAGPPAYAPPARSRAQRLARAAAALALFVAPALVVPRWWCGRGADELFDGRLEAQRPLAREVAAWVTSGVSAADFETGHWQYTGEWVFGTYQMAALGLLQVVQAHPETRAEFLPTIETCLERMAAPQVREFDTRSWGGEDALATLDGARGHAAYLGYFNLVLGRYRALVPQPRPAFTDLNDRITAALARRFDRSPIGLIETYPAEVYPIDNTPGLASLVLHDRATGGDHAALFRARLDGLRRRYVDPASGLLFQAVSAANGDPVDKPRASGTALASYYLAAADLACSRELFNAVKRSCFTDWIGFQMVKEYPPNVQPGAGDIDSGPVLFGLSFSGTGFNLAASRIHGDRDFFRGSYRIATLVGSPIERAGGRRFVCGGPLGNAIMLAVLTAGGTP